MKLLKTQISFDNTTRAKLNHVLNGQDKAVEFLNFFGELLNEPFAKVVCIARYTDRLYADVKYIKFEFSEN